MQYNIKYAQGATVFSYVPATLTISDTNLQLNDEHGIAIFDVPFSDIRKIKSAGSRGGVNKTTIRLREGTYNVSFSEGRQAFYKELQAKGVNAHDSTLLILPIVFVTVVIVIIVMVIANSR